MAVAIAVFYTPRSTTACAHAPAPTPTHPFPVEPQMYACARSRYGIVQMIREMSRQFAETELMPIAGDLDKEHRYPAEQVLYYMPPRHITRTVH